MALLKSMVTTYFVMGMGATLFAIIGVLLALFGIIVWHAVWMVALTGAGIGLVASVVAIFDGRMA